MPEGVSKVILPTGLNVYIYLERERESLGDSHFVTNSLLVFYKRSQGRSISCTNLIFPVTFVEVCPPYQFKTTCTVDGLRKRKGLNTNLMIILEIWQKHPYDIIATTRRGTLMLCSHCPINDSSGCFHITVYFAVMLQASWHTAEGN